MRPVHTLTMLTIACHFGDPPDDVRSFHVEADYRHVVALDDEHAALVGSGWALLEISETTSEITHQGPWDDPWWTVATDGDVVYLAENASPPTRLARATLDGLIRGEEPSTLAELGWTPTALAADGDRIWATDGATLFALEPGDGSEAARLELGGPIGVAQGITVAGSLLLVATTTGTLVLDAADPLAPRLVSTLGRREMWRAGWSERAAFVATGGRRGAMAVDLGDPAAPVWLSSLDGVDNPLRVEGDWLLDRAGLWDVSDPSRPARIVTLPDGDAGQWWDLARVGDTVVRAGAGTATVITDIPW